MNDLDVNPNDNEELGLGDLNDIFDADPFSSAGGGNSPSGSPRGNQLSQPGSPSNQIPGSDPAFRLEASTHRVFIFTVLLLIGMVKKNLVRDLKSYSSPLHSGTLPALPRQGLCHGGEFP